MHSLSLSPVFCPPLLGKPNPLEARPIEGPDTRSRVVQRGSKDNTCWYAVFSLLRDRYRAPNTHHLEGRKFEHIVSRMRKTLSRHEASLPDLADQLNNETVIRQFTFFTKEAVQQPETVRLLQTLDRFSERAPLCPILPKFLEQGTYRTLYDYLVYLKLGIREELTQPLFSYLRVNPKEQFDFERAKDPLAYEHIYGSVGFDLLSPILKAVFLDNLSRRMVAERYGLDVSSWHPQQPFLDLQQSLERQGPLAVGGCFGRAHYLMEPKMMGRTIADRPIYFWSKSDPRNPGRVTGHMILLVGAERVDSRELVYYLDPMDESDPHHPEKQRIYAMSYERLTASDSICDTHGFLRNDAPSSIGYALCRRQGR